MMETKTDKDEEFEMDTKNVRNSQFEFFPNIEDEGISYIDMVMRGDQLLRTIKDFVSRVSMFSDTKQETAEASIDKNHETLSGTDPVLNDFAAENLALREAVSVSNGKLRDVEQQLRSVQTECGVARSEVSALKQHLKEGHMNALREQELKKQVKQMEVEMSGLVSSKETLLTLVSNLKRAQDDLRNTQSRITQKCSEACTGLSMSEEAARQGTAIANKQGNLLKSLSEKLLMSQEGTKKLSKEHIELMNRCSKMSAEINSLQQELKRKTLYFENAKEVESDLNLQLSAAHALVMAAGETQSRTQEVIDAQGLKLENLRAENSKLKSKIEELQKEHQAAWQKKSEEILNLKNKLEFAEKSAAEHVCKVGPVKEISIAVTPEKNSKESQLVTPVTEISKTDAEQNFEEMEAKNSKENAEDKCFIEEKMIVDKDIKTPNKISQNEKLEDSIEIDGLEVEIKPKHGAKRSTLERINSNMTRDCQSFGKKPKLVGSIEHTEPSNGSTMNSERLESRVCNVCNDEPYGLMLPCRKCRVQYHSACLGSHSC